MTLPEHFCWTRFGVEAGEGVGQILMRKESERVSNGGVFLWGIGSAIGASLQELLKHIHSPELIFSPIRSGPRGVDAAPRQVVRWLSGRTMEGERYELPSGSIVTSRAKSEMKRQRHYALVCASQNSLALDSAGEPFAFGSLRNFVSGRPVGASQVTAVVSRRDAILNANGPIYRAAMRVQLMRPYFVELSEPVLIAHGQATKAAAA